MNGTPVRPINNQLNQSCDADISVDGQTPKNKKRRKKKPSQNEGKRRRRPFHKNGAFTIDDGKWVQILGSDFWDEFQGFKLCLILAKNCPNWRYFGLTYDLTVIGNPSNSRLIA